MFSEQVQTQILNQESQEIERARRRRGVLTEMTLREENALYAKTHGVSQNNGSLGFRPGYLNRHSGEWTLSRFGDGSLAPVHVLDGLPESWINGRDADGHVTEVSAEVVSGFVRDGLFYTREEAIRASAH
ncbi:hypothetical protein [Thiocystis violacea]|uniref:hypothetical protein n=1 Tax=Thiocystis violacea TaxID=13725 RepID=UPI001906F939|nr:hypothetical protein [Thiocystis violacea]MBK1716679.1 hypothetical protein [Thiocystis violacea]